MRSAWKKLIINSLLINQNGLCDICKNDISLIDSIDIDHIVQIQNGGKDLFNNLRLLHTQCHRQRLHTSDKIKYTDQYTYTKNAVQQARDNTEREILRKVQEKYIILKTIKQACIEIGITHRQGRYLMQKHGLTKNPRLWDLTYK